MRCERCDGTGSYWRVPTGFNPFSAGGWATARASYKVSCWSCGGSGEALPNRQREYDPGERPMGMCLYCNKHAPQWEECFSWTEAYACCGAKPKKTKPKKPSKKRRKE